MNFSLQHHGSGFVRVLVLLGTSLCYQITAADPVAQIPVSPKPVDLTELKIKRNVEIPVTVFADDQALQKAIRQSKQVQRKKDKVKRANSTKADQVIHLEQPITPYKIVNKGPTFIFQDITQRSPGLSFNEAGALTLQERVRQVEILKQSASARK